MGSSGKRKTTMAKLNRERKLQERRRDKAARKDARRSSPDPAMWGSALLADPEGTEDLEDRASPEGPEVQDQPGAAPESVATPEGVAAPDPA